MRICLILALSVACLGAKAVEPTSNINHYGVNSDYAMPLIDLKRVQNTQRLETGILKDLGEALYKEMNLKHKVLLLPKKRVAPSLLSGTISVLCHLNEIWQKPIEKDVLWSQDVYKSSNLVVYVGSKPINKIRDLTGSRIGVVLNFVYRDLNPYFNDKKIIREDGPNNENNLQKLLSGRINYIVMSNLEYNYYKKLFPNLEAAGFEMDEIMTKCALSKKSRKVTLEELNKAIGAIKKNGTLEKILKSYQ